MGNSRICFYCFTMKVYSLPILLFVFSVAGFVPENRSPKTGVPVSPLAAYSAEWNNARYQKCNTAASARYLSESEKEVIYILNLARINPTLFASTVIRQYPQKSGHSYIINSSYYKSLLQTMQKMKPVGLLYPDSLCWVSAQCHAETAGNKGYVGHARQSEACQQKTNFAGECCDYGFDNPLDILMDLLIDENVPSLGHRDVCLSPYKKLGVSIQPHNTYGHNTVLDFQY